MIITVYRRTEFLAGAIESVLRQSRGADEVIVTDDSAMGEIREICERYDRKLVRYRANLSTLGAARNVAVAALEAKGDCVAILNDDDLWEPDFLKELMGAFEEEPQAVLAFGDHWIMSATGEIDEAATERTSAQYGRKALPRGKVADSLELVLKYNGVPLAMAAAFRREAIDWAAMPEEVAGAYDFWISCRLALTGGAFIYVPERVSRYRVHAAMETARAATDKNENMVFIYRFLLKERGCVRWEEHLRRELASALFVVGRDRMRFGDGVGARQRFGESSKVRFGLKAVLGWFASWVLVWRRKG